MARKHKKKAVVMVLVYLCLAIGVWRWMGQRCLSASVQGEHPKKELRITEIQIKDKVYNKKNQAIIEEYELVGLGNEDLEQEVKKAIRLEAKYDDEQAGMDKEVQVKAFFSKGSALEEAYELRIEGKVKGNIKPKPVRLKLSQDLKVPYTQYREELLVTRVSVSYRAEDVIRGDEKEVDAMPLPQAGIMDEIPRVSDGQPCMTSEEGLPVIGISHENYVYREEGESGIWEQKQADGNYQFVFYEDEKKNLIIEPQRLTMDSLSCRKDSLRVYQDQTEPQTFWMGREGLLKLEPKDQMHYELVAYGRDQSGDLTGSGIGSREGDITCMVSLKAKEPSNGVQPGAQAHCYSQSIQIRLKQDSAPPQVKISMGETPYITKEPKEAMDFGIYSKSILEPSIQIRDWKDENGLGEGSGLGKVSYTVWELEEDLCTQEQIQERIDASVWKPISWEEEDEIKISAGELGISGPCYYAVLVKATDLVGNSNIYCSNGVAVDTRQPELDIRLEGEKARKGIHRGDVQAVVRISDCGMEEEHKTSTGIAEITWQIQQNGKIRESGTEKIRETTEKNRIKDLKNGEILTRKILIRKEYNSNDIKLYIKAKDRAGNEEISVLPLKIDVTEPSVSISYQSREEPQNGFYFKTDRTAVVTVTERNFDPDGVVFYLKKDDEPMKIGTLSQLNEQTGMQVKWRDSQKETIEETEYTDARTHQAKIRFQEEGHYVFGVAACIDLADWETRKTRYEDEKDPSKKEFVIDKTPPVLKVTFQSHGRQIYPGRSEKKRSYQNQNVKVTIRILEEHFALQGRDARINIQIQAEKDGKEMKRRRKILADPGAWSQDANLRISSLDFTGDGNYCLSMEYADLAGNRAVYRPAYFTVDQTKPKGAIYLGEQQIQQAFKSQNKRSIFCQNAQEIQLTGQDQTSGVKQISYYLTDQVLDISQLKKVKKWNQKDSFLLKPETRTIVYAKIQDQAGNTGYIRSKEIILDTKEPKTRMLITTKKPEHGIYSQDVAVRISVYDVDENDACSGLKSVSYQVLNGKKITQSAVYGSISSPASEGIKDFERNILVDAEKNNSNTVVIRVQAVDQAGNLSVREQKLKIDVSRPKISVSYGKENPSNETFYDHPRTARVVIRERNFDPNQVQLLVKNGEGKDITVSNWKTTATDQGTDRHKHTCLVTFWEDGDYRFTVRCGDLAGNQSKIGKEDSFIIDRTAPEIKVSYDRQKSENQVYGKEGRTAVITIKERYFRTEDVKISIEASLDGKKIPAPAIGEFQKEGEIHRAALSFQEDGDYALSISYRDQAGNQAADYGPERFTVDTRPPNITISGIKRSNQGAAAPIVTCEDENLDAQTAEVTLEGVRHGERKFHGKRSSTLEGLRINLDDFAYTRQTDDIYTLRASVSDLAGNKSEDVRVFSVNRFGSVYTLDQSTGDMVRKFYCRKPGTVRIRESNADPLRFQEITCSKDGKLFTLKEGEDYQVLEEKKGWYEYEYVIDQKNFTEDGIYTVTVYSEDQAENQSTNQAKGKKLSFVVDQTKPSLVITGAENQGRYRGKSLEITVDAKDLICLENVRLEVTAEGEEQPEIYTFGREQLSKSYGVVRQEILCRDAWQTLRIFASDRAGNVQEEQLRILVTENIWVLFFTNGPLLVGVFCGLCGLLLITEAILKRFRGKRRLG